MTENEENYFHEDLETCYVCHREAVAQSYSRIFMGIVLGQIPGELGKQLSEHDA